MAEASQFNEALIPFNHPNLSCYTIKQTIGYGTYGIIKLATHNQTGESVAIKVTNYYEHTYKSLLTTKSEMLLNLSHPNIIKFYDIFHDEASSYTFIIQEYSSGGELYHSLQKKFRYNQNDLSIIVYQLINGVEYLHKKNIVHRDLKLENILLKSNDSVLIKIIDFGLALNTSSNNTINEICGSLQYASPEMLNGNYFNPKQSEIWSIGILIFILVCGYCPFDDKDKEALIRKIKGGNVNYPSYVPFIVKDLLQKILNKNPAKRISISKIKEHQLYVLGKKLFFKNELSFIIEPQTYQYKSIIVDSINEKINTDNDNEQHRDNEPIMYKILFNKYLYGINWKKELHSTSTSTTTLLPHTKRLSARYSSDVVNKHNRFNSFLYEDNNNEHKSLSHLTTATSNSTTVSNKPPMKIKVTLKSEFKSLNISKELKQHPHTPLSSKNVLLSASATARAIARIKNKKCTQSSSALETASHLGITSSTKSLIHTAIKLQRTKRKVLSPHKLTKK
jgi:serine/threonine protein kinase